MHCIHSCVPLLQNESSVPDAFHDCGRNVEQILLFILSQYAARTYQKWSCTISSAMRRKSPSISCSRHCGTFCRMLLSQEAFSRILFNNFFHNYSLLRNKNLFPTYFHFTFSPVTLTTSTTRCRNLSFQLELIDKSLFWAPHT